MAATAQKQVNLMDMPLPQLGAIKQQLDQVCNRLLRASSQTRVCIAGGGSAEPLGAAADVGSGQVPGV